MIWNYYNYVSSLLRLKHRKIRIYFSLSYLISFFLLQPGVEFDSQLSASDLQQAVKGITTHFDIGMRSYHHIQQIIFVRNHRYCYLTRYILFLSFRHIFNYTSDLIFDLTSLSTIISLYLIFPSW